MKQILEDIKIKNYTARTIRWKILKFEKIFMTLGRHSLHSNIKSQSFSYNQFEVAATSAKHAALAAFSL